MKYCSRCTFSLASRASLVTVATVSTQDPQNAKAVAKGISFNPGSLFARAKAYGAAQSPVQSPSAVVCLALEEYLTARGWGPQGAAALAKEEAELLLQAKRLGLNPAEILRAALQAAPASAA